MKAKTIFALFMANFIFTSFSSRLLAEQELLTSQDNPPGIIILSTNSISQMHLARKAIEQLGANIKNIFPPSVFIANVPLAARAQIRGLNFIKEVSYGKIDLSGYVRSALSVRDAIAIWNSSLEPQKRTAALLTENLPRPPEYTVVIPSDLPRTKAEKLFRNQTYLQRTSRVKLQGAQSSPLSGNGFGKAYGAGYYDTSLYLAGDVAVGVFFVNGKSGSWTSAEINNAFSAVTKGLNLLLQVEPNARLKFTLIKEVGADGKAKEPPSDIAQKRDYVNTLRSTYNTHWAFMIVVEKYSALGYRVDYLGPSIMFYSGSLLVESTIRQAVMFVFGVQRQSRADQMSAIERYGYLNVVNANSQYNDGKGYFDGAGESMNEYEIGPYTRGQIGWRDADGDGILDPLDTFPEVSQLTRFGRYPLSPSYYTGKARDIALPNEYPASFNFSYVTLNTIATVEYRLNQGGWLTAQPQDGAFDSAEENFKITLPELPKGKYLLEVRAVNSVGNVEKSFARDEIIVNNSSVTNTPPFANFSITPAKGSP